MKIILVQRSFSLVTPTCGFLLNNDAWFTAICRVKVQHSARHGTAPATHVNFNSKLSNIRRQILLELAHYITDGKNSSFNFWKIPVENGPEFSEKEDILREV